MKSKYIVYIYIFTIAKLTKEARTILRYPVIKDRMRIEYLNFFNKKLMMNVIFLYVKDIIFMLY